MFLSQKKIHSKDKIEQTRSIVSYISAIVFGICLLMISKGLAEGNYFNIAGYFVIASYSFLIILQLRDFKIGSGHVNKNSINIFLKNLNPIGKSFLCSPSSDSSRGKTIEYYGVCMFLSIISIILLSYCSMKMPDVTSVPKIKMLALIMLNLFFAGFAHVLMNRFINVIELYPETLDEIDKIEDLSEELKEFIHRHCTRLIKSNGQIYKEELAYIIKSAIEERDTQKIKPSCSYKGYINKRS